MINIYTALARVGPFEETKNVHQSEYLLVEFADESKQRKTAESLINLLSAERVIEYTS